MSDEPSTIGVSAAYVVAGLMIVWRLAEKIFVGKYLDNAKNEVTRRADWETRLERTMDSMSARLYRLEGRFQERDRGGNETWPGDRE